MTKPFEKIRFIVGALALAVFIAVAAPASAQQSGAPVNPTALSVKEHRHEHTLRRRLNIESQNQ